MDRTDELEARVEALELIAAKTEAVVKLQSLMLSAVIQLLDEVVKESNAQFDRAL